MKIKSRLLLTFLGLIILPFALTFGMICFHLSQLENSAEIYQFTKIEEIRKSVIAKVVEGYTYINDYDKFAEHIGPLLKENQLELKVIDDSGRLLFDSKDRESSIKHIIAEEGRSKESTGLQFISIELDTQTLPIYIDGKRVASAVIRADANTEPFNAQAKIASLLGSSLLTGFLLLLVLMVVFTWYLSRSILKPLAQLNRAAEEIAGGNLDYEVANGRHDEIGRFCSNFDQMRIKLKESLEKQALIEQSRKEMIASISHDLRTPIASIKGYVEGLADGVAEDEEMFTHYLEVIKSKTEQLDHLIDDFYEFSKLELGIMEVKLVNADSREVLENILVPYEMEFRNSNIQLNVIRPLSSVMVKADIYSITRLMDNLIQNAIKYAEANTCITIKTELQDEFLVVAVEDNGVGIPFNDLSNIFKIFYRGEKSRSRNFGGTGLGLATCKYIIEAHGGEIWCKSQVGKGSAFYFSLPYSKR